MPSSDLGWDGKIFPDEHVEVRPSPGGGSWFVFLVSPIGEKPLTWGSYWTLDRALEVLLGEPR